MTMLVLILATITFALLYVFGNYYNDMGVTKENRNWTLAIAIIILFIDLMTALSYFSTYNFTWFSDFILEDHWFINSLGIGAILFLLVQLYQILKHRIILSRYTPEEREINEAEELDRRVIARRNIELYKEKQTKEQAEKQRIQRTVAESYTELKCPKCGSTNLTANTKGFGLGKAAVGGVLLGPVGLLGGLVGSKEPVFICLKCGNQFQK